MISGMQRIGFEGSVKMFADWTDRIAAGELPEAPPRPQGLERNVVITQWDWADPKAYLHDLVSTDRRDPTVNAHGAIYGALEASADYLPVLDPVQHQINRVPLSVRDPNTQPASGPGMPQPSPYWGDEAIWNSKANVHNPMLALPYVRQIIPLSARKDQIILQPNFSPLTERVVILLFMIPELNPIPIAVPALAPTI